MCGKVYNVRNSGEQNSCVVEFTMSEKEESRIVLPAESVERLWLEFCDYYNRVSYQIELINRAGLELSRCVWVEGFEDKASLEEDVRK